MREEALRRIMEHHLQELLRQTEGQVTLAELEQSLVDRQGPLMNDLFQILSNERPEGDFPPSAAE